MGGLEEWFNVCWDGFGYGLFIYLYLKILILVCLKWLSFGYEIFGNWSR